MVLLGFSLCFSFCFYLFSFSLSFSLPSGGSFFVWLFLSEYAKSTLLHLENDFFVLFGLFCFLLFFPFSTATKRLVGVMTVRYCPRRLLSASGVRCSRHTLPPFFFFPPPSLRFPFLTPYPPLFCCESFLPLVFIHLVGKLSRLMKCILEFYLTYLYSSTPFLFCPFLRD